MTSLFRTNRQRATVVVGIAVGGLLVASAGVYALLSASAENTTPQAAGSGTLSLVMADNGAGFATAISDLAPGDVVHRYVALTNDGSLDGDALDLTVTDSVGSVLSTDATRGLQAEVVECVGGTWTAATGACSGTPTTVVASTPLAGFGTQAFSDGGAMAPGQTRQLRVTVALPDSTEETVNGVLPANTVQGLSAALTWRFSEAQRAGATSTS